MSRLKKELKNAEHDTADIAQWLDTLSHEERVAELRTLSAGEMRRLWTLTEKNRTTLAEMVPDTVPDLEPVHHIGWNSLPVFRAFEKRFCRAQVGESNAIIGYNEGQTRGVVGPGYFVVRDCGDDERGGIVIDYTLLPENTPNGWPEVRSNTKGVSNLVYAHMHDYMRSVSAHVTVGRAWRKGKVANAYFVLCREPSPS